MTENAKKFMEYVSALDKETMEKVSKMTEKDEIIAYAAEKGFTLTEADFEQADDEKLSFDELDTAAGGGTCACVVGGGGAKDLRENEDGTKTGDGLCVCVAGGAGDGKDSRGVSTARCGCFIGGGGKSVI